MGRKQRELPGMETTDPELEEIAAPFARARYERMALEKTERELHEQLLVRMRAKNVARYVVFDEDGQGYALTRAPGKEKITSEKLKAASATDGDNDASADAATVN